MKIFENKKIMMSILILISIIVISIAFVMNKNYQNKQLLNEIVSYSNKFENESDRNVKLSIFNGLISNEEKYSKNLKENYNKTLLDMKNWFKNDCNNTINENTIKNLENFSDKEAINNHKTNLENLKNTINNEKVLDEKDLSEFINSIDSLIKSYDDRLNAIIEDEKKAEKERLAKEEERIAREKAEQEALAAAQAQQYEDSYDDNSYQHEAPSNSNPSTPSSNTPTNPAPTQSPPASKPSGGVDISRLEHTWNTDENGNKIPGSDRWVDRSNGNSYDVNGNYLGNAYW